jgi:hypothetical protein
MRAILGRFDAGKGMATHDVTLQAPRGCYVLERERAIKRVYNAKIKSGEHVPQPYGPQPRDPRHLRPRLLAMPI